MTPASVNPTGLHWPTLLLALLIMFAVTLYPPMLADAGGHADHRLATLVLVAMAAGFVRGVGFVPRRWLWRLVFSGWTCSLAMLAAAWYRWA